MSRMDAEGNESVHGRFGIFSRGTETIYGVVEMVKRSNLIRSEENGRD